MRGHHLILLLPLVACGLLFADPNSKPAVSQDPEAQLVWRDSGVWLSGDIHIHRLLDERQSAKIARAAFFAGLDFIASTEHPEGGISESEAQRLSKLRAEYPEMVFLVGAEWNLPAGDHASVVIEGTDDEIRFLQEFIERFDRDHLPGAGGDPHAEGTWGELEQAEAGLKWLRAKESAGGPRSVVYLNHMSRHDYLSTAQIGRLMRAGLSGVEAAPGHQRREHPGEPASIDRHEPFVIKVGDGFDDLLSEGIHVGIAAGSDFHQMQTAFYPGQFSRTDVFCPDRTSAGIIRGLQAGATVTVLGGIVEKVRTALIDPQAEQPTSAGMSETLVVARGAGATYRIAFEVPEKYVLQRRNRVDQVEIISNCLGKTRVVARFKEIGDGESRLEYKLPARATEQVGSCFIRARGRRKLGNRRHDRRNADLLFHTSATYLRVVEPL